jgi:hypothetical protein
MALSLDHESTARPRQCAWCHRVQDRAGSWSAAQSRLRYATHGICPPCSAQMRAEIDAAPIGS